MTRQLPTLQAVVRFHRHAPYGTNANWKAASLLKRCPQGLKDRTLLVPNGDELNIVEDTRLKRAARKGCRCKSMPSPPNRLLSKHFFVVLTQ